MGMSLRCAFIKKEVILQWAWEQKTELDALPQGTSSILSSNVFVGLAACWEISNTCSLKKLDAPHTWGNHL
jgi:PIN domain nuclease of toxin-antitoxin system